MKEKEEKEQDEDEEEHDLTMKRKWTKRGRGRDGGRRQKRRGDLAKIDKSNNGSLLLVTFLILKILKG
ncbi:hypothetical protein PoB_000086100 [Plakobranchus ocellatus]|uniref:Uncharacterized protein n=1 Tax=Plakobranchus ocellatus TaxID=259542 RepID=A0AAV3XU73_9GAST|nr:hypothetical protein PoB_000086100 [Plakobranchus ocellatus]